MQMDEWVGWHENEWAEERISSYGKPEFQQRENTGKMKFLRKNSRCAIVERDSATRFALLDALSLGYSQETRSIARKYSDRSFSKGRVPGDPPSFETILKTVTYLIDFLCPLGSEGGEELQVIDGDPARQMIDEYGWEKVGKPDDPDHPFIKVPDPEDFPPELNGVAYQGKDIIDPDGPS